MSRAPGDWIAQLELDPTAWIAPGAVVVGSVRLGARSSVWFNSVMRGDSDRIELGDDSNVQDNSTVHVDEGMPALIGARVTIGHRSIIHGCVIEDDCLIGMGAVVLSGARIGAGSLIGAAALVKEGQVIPGGSLAVGAPARVIGPVADTHRASIRNGSEHYALLSRSYIERGFVRPHPAPGDDRGLSPRNPGHPMSHAEWAATLEQLAHGPDWALAALERHGEARFGAAPAPGRWSALEVAAHLRTADREVFAPRLERLLREPGAALADVAVANRALEPADRGHTARELLGAWADIRRDLVRRLEALGPTDWMRSGFHAVRGPYAVADLARAIRAHEQSHRVQILRALGERA